MKILIEHLESVFSVDTNLTYVVLSDKGEKYWKSSLSTNVKILYNSLMVQKLSLLVVKNCWKLDIFRFGTFWL